MQDLDSLKHYLDEFRSKNPGKKRYPSEFWQAAVTLAKTLGVTKVSRHLGIARGSLVRYLEQASSPRRPALTMVQVPPPVQTGKSITLNLPHGISLRVEL